YVVVKTKRGTETHRVPLQGPTIFGRAPECEVPIPDPRLSRLHCRIEPDGDNWILIDMGSRNGTFVEGQKIERHILKDTGLFEIAHSRVTFHLGTMPPARPKDPWTTVPDAPRPPLLPEPSP